MLLVFSQCLCSLNIELGDSRSDTIFKQPNMCNDFIFGMLYFSHQHSIQLDFVEIFNVSLDMSGVLFQFTNLVEAS